MKEIEHLEYSHRKYILLGLRELIKSGSSVGLYQSETLLDPAYRYGAKEGKSDPSAFGTSEESSSFYKLIKAVSDSLNTEGQNEIGKDVLILDWQSYCQLVVESYDQKQKS